MCSFVHLHEYNSVLNRQGFSIRFHCDFIKFIKFVALSGMNLEQNVVYPRRQFFSHILRSLPSGSSIYICL